MESGRYCQSPALRERRYGYNHLRLRGERMRMARAIAQRLPYRLMLPALDDIPSVRAAVARVTDALAAGLLDPRVAGRLLYACQQTSSYLRWEAQAREKLAATTQPTLSPKLGDKGGAPNEPGQGRRVEGYREFEAEFGLPVGLDLSSPPHMVFPPRAGLAQRSRNSYEHPSGLRRSSAVQEALDQRGYRAGRAG